MCRKSLSISCQQCKWLLWQQKCTSSFLQYLVISLFLSISLSYHNWFEIFLWGSMSSVRCIFGHLRHELSKYVSDFVPRTKLLFLINRCLILSFFQFQFSLFIFILLHPKIQFLSPNTSDYCQLCQYLVEEGEFEVWLVNVILLHGYNVKIFYFNFSVLTQLYVNLLLAYMAMLQNTKYSN